MDIGIGIPNTVSGTTGAQLLDWGTRAEAAGFSTLASIGRVAYPGYEELTVFAAVGAVTERIRFLTNVLLAPTRSGAELAKQSASVDQLTGGRLTLGLAVGARQDDFTLTGRDFADRGRRFDEQLTQLRSAWAGEALPGSDRAVGPGPAQPGGIPILVGGMSDAAVRRVVEHGAGWTAGGAPPDMVRGMVQRVRAAWEEAGREGTPHLVALAYFGLGEETAERSRAYLLDYYAWLGDWAAGIADGALRTPDAIRGAIEQFSAIGIDELILDPTVADADQVERLAEVVR